MGKFTALVRQTVKGKDRCYQTVCIYRSCVFSLSLVKLSPKERKRQREPIRFEKGKKKQLKELVVHYSIYLIALSTVNPAYLHYNGIQHVCEAISGYFVVLDRLFCLASTLDYIVMQMRKTNREKGYYNIYLHVRKKVHLRKIQN